MIIQTVETPDGPFTILSDDEHRVLSSGWTGDRDRILGRLRAADRPHDIDEGETDAAAAVAAGFALAIAPRSPAAPSPGNPFSTFCFLLSAFRQSR